MGDTGRAILSEDGPAFCVSCGVVLSTDMMLKELHITRSAMLLFASVSLFLMGPGSAGAANVSVDGCLAADVNTDMPAQIERVIRLCTSALAETESDDWDRPKLLETRGVALRNRGDLEPSLKDLNEAVALDNSNAGYLRMRGWTLRLIGKLIEAEGDYDGALAIDPDWQGYLSRCVVRADRNNFVGALEDCDKSL